jgi:hypothetical protein
VSRFDWIIGRFFARHNIVRTDYGFVCRFISGFCERLLRVPSELQLFPARIFAKNLSFAAEKLQLRQKLVFSPVI